MLTDQSFIIGISCFFAYLGLFSLIFWAAEKTEVKTDKAAGLIITLLFALPFIVVGVAMFVFYGIIILYNLIFGHAPQL